MRDKVIIDWDDTLCECNSYLLDRLNAEKGTNYKISQITDWGKLNSPVDERFRYMDEAFYKTAPMKRGAKELVHILMNRYDVLIMTAVPPKDMGLRVDRIMKEFPELDPANIMMGSRKDLVQAEFLLDDGFHNIEKSNVKYPVLFRKPWNIKHSGCLTVTNYKDFLFLLANMEAKEKRIGAERTKEPHPVILVGPSGSGKTSLLNEVIKDDRFCRVKTYTERKKRENESEEMYHFISSDEFTRRKKSGELTAATIYHGYRYGLSIQDIRDVLAEGRYPVLVLDISGAEQILFEFKTSQLIFLERGKEECYRAVLTRNLPLNETASRLAGVDMEMRNDVYCHDSIRVGDFQYDMEKEALYLKRLVMGEGNE